MGRQIFLGAPGAAATAISAIGTAAFLDVIRRDDVIHFWDAQCAEKQTKINRLVSHKTVDGVEVALLPTSTSAAPYLIDTSDGQKAVECGVGSTGSNKGTLIGDANALFPTITDPWTVAIRGKQNSGTGGILWGTNGADVQMGLNIQSDGRVVFYWNYNTVLASNVVGASDGDYHLWAVTYDGDGVLKLLRDGSVIDSDSGQTPPTLSSSIIRVGSLNHSGSDPTEHLEGGWEYLTVAASDDADLLTAINALDAERHP